MTIKKGKDTKVEYVGDIPIIEGVLVEEGRADGHVDWKPPPSNPNYKDDKKKGKPLNIEPNYGASAPGAQSVAANLPGTIRQPQQTANTSTAMVPMQQKPQHISNFVDPAAHNGDQIKLGRSCSGCVCPKCGRQTVTTTKDKIGVGTVIAIIILLFLCWPLCWLPLCIPMCKKTNHYCGHQQCGLKITTTRVLA